MKWIVGLGNPGAQYERTRHNLGFMVVERLRRELGAGTRGSTELYRRFEAPAEGIGLLMPQTLMNGSGRAVEALRRREGFEPAEFLVVADDLHLELGKVRIRPNGGAGGHNGLKSIVECLGTLEFPRLRLGTGRPPDAGEFADFVLEEFEEEEEPVVAEVVGTAAEACLVWAREGLAPAMNRFNN